MTNSMNKIKTFSNSTISFVLLGFLLCLVSFLFQCFVYKSTDKYVLYPDSESYTVGYIGSCKSAVVDPYRTPVYPCFTKAIKFIGGEQNWYRNIVIAQKGLFVLSVLLFYLSVSKLTERKIVRVLSTLVYGCCPALIFWNTIVLTESLSIFLFSVLVYLIILMIKEDKMRYDIGVSVLLLFLVLERPAMIFLVAVYGLFWVIKIVLSWKTSRRSQIIKRSLCLLICIIGILGYCSLMRIQHHSFGLSSVGNINEYAIYLDGRFYKNVASVEEEKFLDDALSGNENDGLSAFAKFSDYYGNEKTNALFEKMKKQTSFSELVGYFLNKTGRFAGEELAVIYASRIDVKRFTFVENINHFLFPLKGSTVLMLVLFSIALGFWVLLKNKRLDWIIFWLSAVMGGNIFVAIVGAPYETARLSVLAIPSTILLIAYYCSIFVYSKKRSTSVRTKQLKGGNR